MNTILNKLPLQIRNLHFSVLLPSAALIVLYIYIQFFWYLSGGRDDVFISMWSAYGVSHGYGFVNYNLEPLEVSSSFLHVLILTTFWWINPDFVYLINKTFGLSVGATTLVVIIHSSPIIFKGFRYHKIASLLVVFLLICSPVWMYWTVGGLENSIVSLILVCMAIYMVAGWQTPCPQYVHIGICAALMCLVRSEGIIYVSIVLLFGLAKIIFHGKRLRPVAIMILIPILVFITITLWRLASFGLLFPNPTYAKVYPGNYQGRILSGWNYLVHSYTYTPLHAMMWPILIGFFIGLIYYIYKHWQDKVKMIPASLWVFMIILCNHMFVTLSGGDWMEYYRFVQPVVPLMIICFVFFLIDLVSHKHTYYQLFKWIIVGFSIYMLTQLEWGSLRWQARINVPNYVYAISLLVLVLIWGMCRWRNLMVIKHAMLYSILVFICLTMVLPLHNMTRCSKILNFDVIQNMNVVQFQQHLLEQNCAHGRDLPFVYSFIKPRIHELSQLFGGKVVMISKQGGFIPFYIKTQFPEIDFYFVDEYGLSDAYVAQLKQKYGLAYMNSHEWSDYLTSKNINVWYMFHSNYVVLKKYNIYREQDWQIIYRSRIEVVSIPKSYALPTDEK